MDTARKRRRFLLMQGKFSVIFDGAGFLFSAGSAGNRLLKKAASGILLLTDDREMRQYWIFFPDPGHTVFDRTRCAGSFSGRNTKKEQKSDCLLEKKDLTLFPKSAIILTRTD